MTVQALVTADVTAGNLPLTVNFGASGSTSTATITGYAWNFGDATTGTGATPSGHVYTDPGAYLVSCVVTDSSGAADTAYVAITVLGIPALPLSAEVWNEANTSIVVTLPSSWNRDVTPLLSEPGSGSLVLPNTATTELAEIVPGRRLRFKKGTEYVFTGLIEDDGDSVVVDQSEEHGQTTTVHVRDQSSELAGLLIYPVNGVGGQPWDVNRYFDMFDPNWDTSGMSTAVIGRVVSDPHEGYWPPKGYPDPLANYIWSVGESSFSMPVGDMYFIVDVTLAGDTTVTGTRTADDGFRDKWDGIDIGQGEAAPGESWRNCYEFALDATAGTHRYGGIASNYPRWWGSTFNIAGFVASLYTAPTGGGAAFDNDNFLIHTGYQPGGVTPFYWLAIDSPASAPVPIPGFTYGEWARVCLTEEQGRGRGVGITFSFTDSLDSLGNTWSHGGMGDMGQQMFPIGTNLEAANKTLHSKGLVETAWDPIGRVWHAWNYGTRGPGSSGIALARGVNLLHYEIDNN